MSDDLLTLIAVLLAAPCLILLGLLIAAMIQSIMNGW